MFYYIGEQKLNLDDPLEVLMNIIAEVIVDDWVDLGLGRVSSGQNEVQI